ncbi:MAG: DUF302 domain-containing protein [Chlorobi bacterium]|nr:DUF302 domain-containing protein [Chlorobiota bacterium]
MKQLKLKTAGYLMAIILFSVTLSMSNQLFAQNSDLVTVQSAKSYDNTVDQLKTMISKNGMMVLAEINHGKILSMTGLKMNGVSLFVGNPQIGKKIFTVEKGVGVAVPIRINVFEGDDGKTYINYVKPSAALSSFNNKVVKETAMMLDKKVQMLTSMMAK